MKALVFVLGFVALLLAAPHAQAEENLTARLLQEGEARQVIQFNPNAALQRRIFADRYVPNSPEFRLTLEGVTFAAQRAEDLSTGAVRVYFAKVGDYSNVAFVQRGEPGAPFAGAMLDAGEAQQVLQFNPDAALQKTIFADRFVPNSPELRVTFGGNTWAAQRAENLGSGAVRVYYAPIGDWGSARFVERGVGDVGGKPGWTTYTSQAYPYAVSYPAGWQPTVNSQPQAGQARDVEAVTLRQPGYGGPGKFSTIDIFVSRAAPYWPRTDCSTTTIVAGGKACYRYQAAGQNPAQEWVQFQRGDAFYDIRIVYADDQNAAEFAEVFNQVVRSFQFTG